MKEEVAAPRGRARHGPLRAHPRVAGFTAGYIVAFGVWSFGRGEAPGYLVYAGVMVVLMALVARVEQRIGLGPYLLAALSAWGLAHMAGGLIPVPTGRGEVLYNVVLIPGALRFDQAVHAFGFGAAAAVCRKVLLVRAPALVPGSLALVVWLMGMGLGALNEVVEFCATVVQPSSNVGGYENTALDLVFNMLGSGVVAATSYRRALRAAPG